MSLFESFVPHEGASLEAAGELERLLGVVPVADGGGLPNPLDELLCRDGVLPGLSEEGRQVRDLLVPFVLIQSLHLSGVGWHLASGPGRVGLGPELN